jgi:pimeloyl-ACP methyl ester carboxylesterase
VSAPRLYDIGGRRLALRQVGQGPLTVVLEMGLGAAGDAFADIARGVAAFTRVVWYDRAGLGASDPAATPPTSRTVSDLASDLHALLRAAAIPPPHILAGHSLGGLTVRYFQHAYPAEVAALVFIESAHEEQRERLLAALPPQAPDEPAAIADYRHALLHTWADPSANSEGIDNIANSALMRACGGLGALPLVVISRGLPQPPAGFSPDLIEARERAWRVMQDDLAARSSRSLHLIAERSGHLVNRDQPEIIVGAIRQALAMVEAR